jgi:hypothetical protein
MRDLFTTGGGIVNFKLLEIPFYETVQAFLDSARDGCHLCTILWASQMSSFPLYGTPGVLDPDRWRKPITAELFMSVRRVLTIRIRVLDHVIGRRLDCRYVSTSSTKCDHGGKQADVNVDDASNASRATLRLASSWLSDCVSHHAQCKNATEAFVKPPSRLIMTRPGESQTINIVSVEHRVRYLALSHVWGKVAVLQLTEANYERLRNGFDRNELPPMFRDCLTVAERLGVHYVWIDSICIIQDSPEDWAHEASCMSEVYRGAYCTIAAVSAFDSMTSLFTKTNPLAELDCIIKDPIPILGGKIIVTLDLKTPLELMQAPLYTRAWVLQERLLSPRILEFTNRGIRWYCPENMADNNLPHSSNNIIAQIDQYKQKEHAIGYYIASHWKELLSISAYELGSDIRSIGIIAWMKILRSYHSMKLTRESDRPHAIKGLITLVEQRTGLSFIEGVCKDAFPYSILWVKDNAPDRDTEFRERAILSSPSWSCAFRCAYRYRGPSQTDFTHVASVTANTNVVPPVLNLKGLYHGPTHIYPYVHEQHESGIEPSMSTSSIHEFGNSRDFPGTTPFGDLQLFLQLDFRLYSSECVLAHFVLLAQKVVRGALIGYGLVLEPDEAFPSRWVRIGVFQFRNKEWRDTFKAATEKGSEWPSSFGFHDEKEFIVC